MELEGERTSLRRECEELRMEIGELGGLKDVQEKKEDLEGQIEEKTHALQALISEQNDLIVRASYIESGDDEEGGEPDDADDLLEGEPEDGHPLLGVLRAMIFKYLKRMDNAPD